VSLIPLAFKHETMLYDTINSISVIIFIIDYILRFITADFKFRNKSYTSFIKYPFSGYALIDLLSILPSLTHINSSLKLLRIFRMIRAFKVFRVFKTLRYSKSFMIIQSVLRKSQDALIAVLVLAISYIYHGTIDFQYRARFF
ncbi:ion transporter, partial [Anaerorhabdus sp.]|uniref:ion transporter n=1 Tax=Anaerorhabdus sp. TaxID=1872524 RepID=UPI003FA60578